MIIALASLALSLVAVVAIMGRILIVQESNAQQHYRDWSKERADLLQRIQSPEQAVISHAVGNTDLTFPVPFDDDEEAFLAAEARNA